MPVYFLLCLCLVLLDQLSKWFVTTHIGLNQVVSAIPGLVSFTHLRNYGAAWSILVGQQWFFTIVTLIALIVMGYFLWKLRQQKLYVLGLVIMFAGTLGNFIDRIRLGYVVDMVQLDFINFPIFNLADMCLTFGVIILIIAVWKEDQHA
jgi:signal peptidase II